MGPTSDPFLTLCICRCRCCWTSSLGCGSTCHPPRQTSAGSGATLWHSMGTWYRNLTWPQPHMCWGAGTRTLRPSRSPQSGFGRVSGNEGWWLPARTAASPLPSADPSWPGRTQPDKDGLPSPSSVSSKTHPPCTVSSRSQVLGCHQQSLPAGWC